MSLPVQKQKFSVLRALFVTILILVPLWVFFGMEDAIPIELMDSGTFTYLFFLLGLVMVIANVLYFAWQILLVGYYKEFPDVPIEELPTCAVVIPAYNEGRDVMLAIESVLASDYPPDKLDIIAVNDGSSDDTWEWIRKAAEASNGRVRTINMSCNGGKRKALAAGFSSTDAEIVLSIDSDSIVYPETVRKMAAPLAADPTIGAVAGNVRVSNLKEGLIPRMLDVGFVFGFEFLRSAQSVLRAVLCTPGALSGYRRSAILPFLDEWVNETFFGRPANIGEDRALTNILIREGRGIVYQNSARVLTKMPTTYGGLCKMLIRWGRSNVRENFSMMKFLFRHVKVEDGNLFGNQMNLIFSTFWMIGPVVYLGYSIYCLCNNSIPFLIAATVAILFWATLPAFVYAKRYRAGESLISYVYGFFSFFMLCWISPYSVFTVHRSGWLTRGKAAPAAASAGGGPGAIPAPEAPFNAEPKDRLS